MPLFCRHEAALVALMSISVGNFVPIKWTIVFYVHHFQWFVY
jgi:hypothetical protein